MTDLMAGEIVAALLLLVGVITLIALQGKDNPGPDVGVDIVDCGMVHDCDGCDECGAPMVIEIEEHAVVADDNLSAIDYAVARTADRGQRDFLLDRRNELRRRVS